MKKWLVPVCMISLGLNLLIGFQNCAEVDPNFAYQENDTSESGEVKTQKVEQTRFADISEIKINTSKVTRYQRSVAYQLDAEFRVKYSNEYLGASPKLLTENLALLDRQNGLVAKLQASEIDILEQNCVESVDVNMVNYFDCKYKLTTKQKVDISPKSLKKEQYRIGNQRGVIAIALELRGTNLKEKDYLLVSDYVDRYNPINKKPIVKKKTALPKVAKKKKALPKKKVVKKAKVKKKVVSKKKIEKKKIVEGIHCHIQVLNPPHLELLSDVKKTGMYYEDTQNCKEAAIQLSKKYCDRSLMGEIDYNLSIKDTSKAGTKTLEKHIDSIECGDII